MDGVPAWTGYPVAGRIHVVFRGQGAIQLIGLTQCLNLGAIQIPGAGDVIQQVFEQRFRNRLLKDIRMFVGEPADLGIQLPEQGFDGGVHRVDPGLQSVDKGTGRFPEFAPGRFLAQAHQPLDYLLHVIEMGVEVRLANHASKGKLVHLAQLAQVAQDFWIVQAFRHLTADPHL